MNKKTFVKYAILWIFLPAIALAQTKESISRIDSVRNEFVKLYNEGNGKAIFNMCDTGFQKYLKSYNYDQWSLETKQHLGECIQTIKTKQLNDAAVYKAYFQNDSMSLTLAINRLGKMTGFIIKPLPLPQKKYIVQSNNPLKNSVDSLVERIVRPYIQQENTVGVSIGIIDNGKIYSYGYGETEKGNHQIPTDNTIYEIGSITKTFTATLLAEMVLLGKCKLSDPVNKYLPDSIPVLQKNGVKVTLEMLANHTSGLPREASDILRIIGDSFSDPYRDYDDNAMFSYLDSVKLRSVPGTRFVYSNLGFGLLGTILERISGLNYQQSIEKCICNPLHLTDTRTTLSEKQQQRFAEGYSERGNPTLHYHFESMAGCGAIRSSVQDMLKYLNAHLTENDSTNLLKAFQLCERPTFQIVGNHVGLGLLIPEYSPEWYWHNGRTGGFSSYCAFNPDKKIALVILANSAIGVDNEGIELRKALSK
ncbi:MAG: hypothetical protein EPN39_08315 [Chitinophagaceae bacterium]|nr:MAG: hypothetical protein EPN39_08315 [Chitinophagaceae bacterium]